jgi:hypothetical protein
VRALFEKNTSDVFRFFSKGVEVAETERGCTELYEEARANPDNNLGTYASAESEEDARQAFYAIRNYKQQHGIPFDVESLT